MLFWRRVKMPDSSNENVWTIAKRENYCRFKEVQSLKIEPLQGLFGFKWIPLALSYLWQNRMSGIRTIPPPPTIAPHPRQFYPPRKGLG